MEEGDGMLSDPDAGGCFSSSLLKFSSDGLAGRSAELIMRTAALILPSSILAVMTEARAADGSFGFPGKRTPVGARSSVPPALRLMMEARLCRAPPLAGLDRIF